MDMDKKPYRHLNSKDSHNAKILFGAENEERLKEIDEMRSQAKERAKSGSQKSVEVIKSAYTRQVDGELFDMQNLTRSELAKIGKMLIGKSAEEIMELVQDGQAPALHAMFASVIGRILRTGDMVSFNALLDRLIGKVEAPSMADDGEVIEVNNRLEVVVEPRKIRLPANGRESNVG